MDDKIMSDALGLIVLVCIGIVVIYFLYQAFWLFMINPLFGIAVFAMMVIVGIVLISK